MKAPSKQPGHDVLHTKHGAAKAIGLAARILATWGATYDQASNILRVSRSVYAQAIAGTLNEVKLDRDQLQRAALVVNMHGAIRTVFSNPDNVKNFMGMANGNAFFDGRSPFSIIQDGDFVALYETHRRIDALRGAGW